MNATTDIRNAVRVAAQAAGAELAPHADKIAGDLNVLVSDADGLLKQVQSLSGDAATAARIQLERKMREVRASLDGIHAAATTQSQRAIGTAGDYVRRQPLWALGMAAAVGLVAGIVIARR